LAWNPLLQRDANGQAIPEVSLDGLPATFKGACASHQAGGDRAFYSQLMLSDEDLFQIFQAPTSICFSEDTVND
jgi:hypothetical protein